MKKIIILTSLFISSLLITKADSCDSLELLYLGYNPLNSSELIVYVPNTNVVEFFSYPGFKLVDDNGDTVATETVNFFGIGEYSAHTLNTTITGYVPGTTFSGTLLLYTGFYDSLVCSFPVSEILIPTSGCTDFRTYTTNYTGNIQQALNWTIKDETGTIIFSGTHNYAIDSIGYMDSVCLENGCYTFTVTAQNPLEDVSTIGISFINYFADTSLQMNAGATSASFDFTVYLCDSSVSINEQNNELDFSVFPNPAFDVLKIDWKLKTPLLTIEVFDIAGKSILLKTGFSDANFMLDISFLSAGIYAVQLRSISSTHTRKIIKFN